MSDQEQPSTSQITKQLRKIITKAAKENAVDQLTKRIVREQLEEHFGVELHSQKKYINQKIQELVNETVSKDAASEDDQQDEPPVKKQRKAGKPQSKASAKAQESDEEVQEEEEEPEEAESEAESKEASGASDAEEGDNKSEAGFSSLDEAGASAAKPRAKKGRSSSPAKKKASAPRKKSEKEQPEALKKLTRLKQLVVACGVRKPWKKLYEQEGITEEDDYKAQCSVVESVLRDLGMSGRGSMEQAKRIREEREFQDELAALQDNVIDESSRGRRRAAPGRSLREESPAESDQDTASRSKKVRRVDDESEDEGPRKPSFKNSLASFAAGLNSDSESD